MKKKSIISFFLVVVLFLSTASASFANSSTIMSPIANRVSEVVSLRKTDSETYLMSDGTYECIVYAYDKYYLDKDKTLQPISNTIIPIDSEKDPTAPIGCQYRNSGNAFDVFFSTNTPQISICYKDSSIRFTPVNISQEMNTSTANKKTDFAIGKIDTCPTLNILTDTGANTILYNNVFNETDLVYVLDNNAVKEYIVLNSASSPNSYKFIFTLDGVHLQSSGKHAVLLDAAGNTLFTLDPLYAIDANGVVTESLTYNFTPIEGTNNIMVTISLNNEYIKASDRAFPIVIDPTVMVSSSETADACVCSYYPNTNFQMATQLRTGFDTDYGVRRSFIKFNIPSSVPTGSVTAARLDIEKLSGSAPTMKAYYCTDLWSSGTITWNNKPVASQAFSSSLSTQRSSGSNWYTMNVTEIVKKWVNQEYNNYGFELRDTNETNPNHWTTLYSSDAPSPHKPELHITYECENVTVELLYDINYFLKYSNPNSRIINYATALQERYLSEFGISINFLTPAHFSSYVAENCTVENGDRCNHTSNALCTNTPLNYSTPTNITALHHTNIYNIMAHLGASPTPKNVRVVFIEQVMCEKTSNECTIVAYDGKIFEPLRLVAILDDASYANELETVIHEFGHLYGVIDHYGGMHSSETTDSLNNKYQGREFNKICIYGEYKFENPAYVTANLPICDGCRSFILENRDLYSK